MIPEDWEIRPLGEVLTLKNGFAFSSDFFSNEGPIVLTPGNFSLEGGLYFEERNTKRYSGPYLSSAIFNKGDLLIVMTDLTPDCKLLGKPAFVERDEIILHNQRIGKIQYKDKKTEPRFLFYLLLSRLYLDNIKDQATGSTVRHTSNKNIYNVQLAWPKTLEQRAIATALSDMDTLLDGLDGLITKKRAIKQATMQQLLTGQTRLPGFSGEWEVKRLGEHLSFLKNGVNSRAELSYSEGIRYLHYGDIHGCSRVMLNPASVEMPRLPRDKASRLDRLQDGDLIYADASEDIDGIGKSVEVQNVSGVELVAGLHTIAIRFDKRVLADGFKAYIQFIPEFRAHLRQLASGTKVYATNRAHIASAELRLPGVDEQRAISALLTDMDTEITALETRRTKTRALKQAMMQELLTGRTRLV
ncbi:restriction endonuclease subunit S [Ectopseudomonas hydrolytica]|uniref:restriction endonuclease subunit S n=1 Tax=Ectopseudomonas hydrolytica TaxID=2493633 RepID=UPI003EE12721